MKRRRLCSLMLVAALTLSGCGVRVVDHSTDAAVDPTTPKSEGKVEVGNKAAPGSTLSVLDIKHKYATTNETQFSPFYNVAQDTVFQFHFDTMVEPCYAITVHTDPKCEQNSLVYQLNDGYLSGSGVDVVVKPGRGVLRCEERVGNVSEDYYWGNAPIYYLAIRRDFHTGEKLAEPTVIPFTVKSDVSVPTIYANMDKYGQLYLTWNEVPGAVSYNIYTSYTKDEFATAPRQEMGFIGDSLTKKATVTTTEYYELSDNPITEVDGYVSQQNVGVVDNYFVTAVDAAGNESFFSYPVCSWSYWDRMPLGLTDWANAFGEKNSNRAYINLPDTVSVTMRDKTTKQYPVRYTKTKEEYGEAFYDYEVIGTKLTGSFRYFDEDGNYPATKDSSALMDYGIYKIDNNINIVPTNDIETIKGKTPNLSGGVDLDPANKLPVSYDARMTRADQEAARILREGEYLHPLEEVIPTYIDSTLPVEPQETEPETTAPQETETEVETEPVSVSDTPQDDIVSMNEEQTKTQVEEGNSIEVKNTSYPVFADTPEEEYLALCMIDSQERIDISAFPRLLDASFLLDTLMKVIRQNPYIISPKSVDLDGLTTLVVYYEYDAATNAEKQAAIDAKANSIVSQVITEDMSVEQRIEALWDYLEDNTEYDHEACEVAAQNNFMETPGYEDSFNAYGILCNNVGVCQSYSYAFHILAEKSGVTALTLTGYLNGNLPHAWNVVMLDNAWYWIDTTNNQSTAGVPYLLYQTSYNTAIETGYTLDDEFLMDKDIHQVYTTDNSKDWYYQNNMVARSIGEVSSLFKAHYADTPKGTFMGVKLAVPLTETEVAKAALQGVMDTGSFTIDDLKNCKYLFTGNYIFLER